MERGGELGVRTHAIRFALLCDCCLSLAPSSSSTPLDSSIRCLLRLLLRLPSSSCFCCLCRCCCYYCCCCCCSPSISSSPSPYLSFPTPPDAKPSNDELPIYTRVAATLNQQTDVMRALLEYKGCQELARRAMSSPTPENESAAFEGLLASVDSVSLFYNYAKELERVTPELLTTLTKDGGDCKSSLSDQQALAKQLADIFDFTLRFDALRMERPFLPNDFSYYRRLLPKFNKHPGVKVKDDEASGMALFTAEHIPMMTTLARACSQWGEEDPRNQHVMDALALMANSCMKMIKNKK